jgi:hypothetical protein
LFLLEEEEEGRRIEKATDLAGVRKVGEFGSETATQASKRHNRRWVGTDISGYQPRRRDYL